MARTESIARPVLDVILLAPTPVDAERSEAALSTDGLRIAAEPRTEAELPDARPADALVLVLDEGITGADATIRRVRGLTEAPMVVVCDTAGDVATRKLFDAGADGLVLGNDLDRALAPTVRAVCAGQVVAPRARRQRVNGRPLSYRERQVLGMVVLGFTNAEIAGKLRRTESTIKSHLSSAFAKLGVKSRHEATAMIVNHDSGLGTGILSITEAGEEE